MTERSSLASFSACGGSLLRQNSLPPHGDPRRAFLCHRTHFPMTQKPVQNKILNRFFALKKDTASHSPFLFFPITGYQKLHMHLLELWFHTSAPRLPHTETLHKSSDEALCPGNIPQSCLPLLFHRKSPAWQPDH